MRVCTFCTPAFADGGEPRELDGVSSSIDIYGDEDYIIRSGDYTVYSLFVDPDATLTIAEDVKVTVTEEFGNVRTIYVLDTLIVDANLARNMGEIHVMCGGEFEGDIENFGCSSRLTHTYDGHYWVNGSCTYCHAGKYDFNGTGSMFSGGSAGIIIGCCALLVGLFLGILIGRKTKAVSRRKNEPYDGL